MNTLFSVFLEISSMISWKTGKDTSLSTFIVAIPAPPHVMPELIRTPFFAATFLNIVQSSNGGTVFVESSLEAVTAYVKSFKILVMAKIPDLKV